VQRWREVEKRYLSRGRVAELEETESIRLSLGLVRSLFSILRLLHFSKRLGESSCSALRCRRRWLLLEERQLTNTYRASKYVLLSAITISYDSNTHHVFSDKGQGHVCWHGHRRF